jgi:hypothetical protein
MGVKMNEIQGAALYWLQSRNEKEILSHPDTSPIIITFRVIHAISNLIVTKQLKSEAFLRLQNEAHLTAERQKAAMTTPVTRKFTCS